MVAVCPTYAQRGSVPQRHAAVAVGQRGDACNSVDAYDGPTMDPDERAGVESAAKYTQRLTNQVSACSYMDFCIVALCFNPVDIVYVHKANLFADTHTELAKWRLCA